MSDVVLPTAAFFTLYSNGHITADDINDFVGAWHESGREERRSLPEFLGLTEDEFAMLVMDDRTLPMILSARRDRVPLRTAAAGYLATLRANLRSVDRAAIHALSHRVNDREAQ